MAKNALRIFSLKGFLAEKIDAIEIKGRADARKKGPFLDDDNGLLLWVDWSRPKNQRCKKPYFRHYPHMGGERTVLEMVSREIKERCKSQESERHRRAKNLLGDYLKEMLREKRPLNWHFKDDEASDFGISGNLLSEAEEIAIESYRIKLPFGGEYRPDIAILGRKIENQRVLLGIIELEFTHEAELLKCLLCKATGAPLACPRTLIHSL